MSRKTNITKHVKYNDSIEIKLPFLGFNKTVYGFMPEEVARLFLSAMTLNPDDYEQQIAAFLSSINIAEYELEIGHEFIKWALGVMYYSTDDMGYEWYFKKDSLSLRLDEDTLEEVIPITENSLRRMGLYEHARTLLEFYHDIKVTDIFNEVEPEILLSTIFKTMLCKYLGIDMTDFEALADSIYTINDAFIEYAHARNLFIKAVIVTHSELSTQRQH